MTQFDFVVIGVLLLSLLLGVWRGLVYEVLSLVGWPLAFISSKLLAHHVTPWMPGEQQVLRLALAYALVFIVTLIAWSILVWAFSKLVKAVGLGGLDRALGGFFGIVRGALLVLGLVWLAGLTDIPDQTYWRQAWSSKALEDVAILTKGYLPDGIAQLINYRIRS